MTESFEQIKNKYYDWLYNSVMVEYFKELYPKSEVITEVLDSGRIIYRVFSPLALYSKEPSMYLFKYNFFDFESGHRGNTSDFIFRDFSPFKDKEKIKYFSRKSGLNLNKILIEYPDEWDTLLGESSSIDLRIDTEIGNFTKLGVNHNLSKDGIWVNDYTDKPEEPVEYYLKNFNDFQPAFQSTILTYMPTVKKAIESMKNDV
jgi:hypothetical protein